MKSNMKKKLVSLLLTATLLMGAAASPVGNTPKAAAAGKAYMKTHVVNWDLKKGKTLPLTVNYPGIGKQKYSVEVTTYKTENASKKGFKKLTIAFKATRLWEPTKERIDKIVEAHAAYDHFVIPNIGSYTVADYNTGVSLEGKNDFGVTCKSFKGKYYGTKKYYGSDNFWIEFEKSYTSKFQITYPKNYKGLCIGLLGSNTIFYEGKEFMYYGDVSDLSSGLTSGVPHSVDDAYFEGKKYKKIGKNKYVEDSKNGTPFKYGQTTYYLKGKKNSHWMRVK